MASLIVPAPESVLARRSDLAAEGKALVERSLAPNTRRAQASDWRIFESWCGSQGVPALPATVDTVFAYLVDVARTRSLETVRRYRATLSKVHGLRGFESPCRDPRVKTLMEGLRRTRGTKNPNAKRPVTAELARQILAKPPTRLLEVRDRAVVLVGLATALRREELCSLDVTDFRWKDEGVTFLLRKSKTDQTGEGRYMAVPRTGGERCPVAALETWLKESGITTGPLFRRMRRPSRGNTRTAMTADRLRPGHVAQILKSAVAAVGLDPAAFGAHSMRAGYVTQARHDGFSWETIMEQTGHKRIETVRRYAREEEAVDPFKKSRVKDIFAAFAGPAEEDSDAG